MTPPWHAEAASELRAKEDGTASFHTHTALARLLRVQLVREGRDVVCVEMPARTAFRLEDLLSDDVRSHSRASGRTTQELQAELPGRGLVPGEVLREATANGTLVLSLV